MGSSGQRGQQWGESPGEVTTLRRDLLFKPELSQGPDHSNQSQIKEPEFYLPHNPRQEKPWEAVLEGRRAKR